MGSIKQSTDFGHAMSKHFLFDPRYKNVNHGSFGTYPAPVRDALHYYQARAEAAPDRFLRYTCPDLLETSRVSVAQILNVPMEECVFVQNATSAINLVLRNLVYAKGDVIIYFDTVYGACEKILASILETTPHVAVRKVKYEFPCSHDLVVKNFLDLVKQIKSEGLNPKVALFDTIVSMPGVRFPFERLTAECKTAGILSCIDGAHSIGHMPLDLRSLDADFFVSNCHKQVTQFSFFFHVPERNQHLIRTPYPTSHGFRPVVNPDPDAPIRNPLPPDGKSAFVSLFQFVATVDSSPYYCVPAAIKFRQEICGGEDRIYQYSRDVAQNGADRIAAMLGTEVMDDGVDWRKGRGGLRDCALATLRLPLTLSNSGRQGEVSIAEVSQARLWIEAMLVDHYETFAAIFEYKGKMWCRVSGQIYLEPSDFEWLGKILQELCEKVKAGAHRRSKL